MLPSKKHDTPRRRHRPPHFAGDGEVLFITAATHQRHPYLRQASRKDFFRDLLGELASEEGVELIAWVVLDQHYHAVVRAMRGETFPEWIGRLHNLSSDRWNAEDQVLRRQCWYQYWDTTLRGDGDLWSRINYVHRNPMKHGCVEDPYAWPWSSLREFDPLWEDPAHVALRERFKAPLKLPGDDF